MKFESTGYNPLETIFSVIPKNKLFDTTQTDDFIQSELFCGGIILENTEEFNIVLELLREMKHGKK
jgi:hypothetical protein